MLIISYFSEIIQRSRSLTKLFLMRVQMKVMTMNGFLRFRQKHKGINFTNFNELNVTNIFCISKMQQRRNLLLLGRRDNRAMGKKTKGSCIRESTSMSTTTSGTPFTSHRSSSGCSSRNSWIIMSILTNSSHLITLNNNNNNNE